MKRSRASRRERTPDERQRNDIGPRGPGGNGTGPVSAGVGEVARPGPDRLGPVPARRVLGRVDGPVAGPTLLCIGGLHGNEPAGVLGLQRVLELLEDRQGKMKGRFVALGGNLGALAARRRFLDSDLNRLWEKDRVRRVRERTPPPEAPSEEREQMELLEAIEETLVGAEGAVYVLDLHTTSGLGGPFTTVADTLPNRAFARHMPVPLILGLEELVDGTLLEYMGERGYVSMAFESGQHHEQRAVDRAEAGIWIALAASGVLPEHAVPELSASRKLLAQDTRGLPEVLEMRHRHPVREGDRFRMHPGYRNFQEVDEGEVLAVDREGEITSPESARVLMPLYQEQGTDGFFVVREFRPFWLSLSHLLRRLRVGRIVHWLPGVRRSEVWPDALVVDRRLARWYALQIFHLLGFRKVREEGDRLVVLRRSFDSFDDGGAGRDSGGEPGS